MFLVTVISDDSNRAGSACGMHMDRVGFASPRDLRERERDGDEGRVVSRAEGEKGVSE